MKDNGGFDHNLQGLRVVEELEQRYADFSGLNLTWETREGINKHTTMFDKAKKLSEAGSKIKIINEDDFLNMVK